jgi:small subunit ribosomal protein S8e
MRMLSMVRKSVENLTKRKPSGGRRIRSRIKRKYEIDRYPNEPLVGSTEKAIRRVHGGNSKIAIRAIDYANVTDPESHRTTKARIVDVVENPANRDYDRRGVISKGAIIQTEVGNARVVSRPGQDGVVNALLTKTAAA